MAVHYENEKMRQNVLISLLDEFIGITITPSSRTGQNVADGTFEWAGCGVLYMEIQNEVGTGGSDSYPQVITYYVKGMNSSYISTSPLPASLK